MQFPGIIAAVNFGCECMCTSDGCTRLQPHISDVQVVVAAYIGERVCRLSLRISLVSFGRSQRQAITLACFVLLSLPAASCFGVQVFVISVVGERRCSLMSLCPSVVILVRLISRLWLVSCCSSVTHARLRWLIPRDVPSVYFDRE
jgi:hypothetical protein